MNTLPDAPPGAPLDEQVAQLKPRPGCVFLVLPIVGVALTFLAYGWLLWNGWIGRPATGPEVEIAFEGCPEAAPVVVARLQEMGLGAPPTSQRPGGFSVTAQLPTATMSPTRFAADLAVPGRLEFRHGEELLADEGDLVYAGVRLDVMMTPSTLVILEAEARDRVYARMGADPGGKTRMILDGVEVWSFSHQTPSMNGEFEIPPSAANDQERMELAAARGIALQQGPLPCPVKVVSATTVGAAP